MDKIGAKYFKSWGEFEIVNVGDRLGIQFFDVTIKHDIGKYKANTQFDVVVILILPDLCMKFYEYHNPMAQLEMPLTLSDH